MLTSRLPFFQPTTIRPSSALLIFGNRGYGKTTLLDNIVQSIQDDYDEAIVFTHFPETLQCIHTFPDTMVLHDFNIDLLKDRIQKNNAFSKPRRMIVLVDEFMSDSKTFISIAEIAKANNVTVIVSLQRTEPLSTILKHIQALKKLSNTLSTYDYVFSFEDNYEFNEMLNDMCQTNCKYSITRPYSCLVLDCTSQTPEISWYKAELNANTNTNA